MIYYQNSYSLGAGLITVLTNRIGDVGLILSIALLMGGGHWFIPYLELDLMIAFLVVLGAITKSAQFPFSSWLPMAIAAPTPVSALVHSSTLVTAGVYLLIRFYDRFSEFSEVGRTLLVLRRVTIVLAGLAAFVEADLKKVIAYSTLRQLGVMVVALGLGRPFLSFFHLLSHAMFKALMFICAGSYIHYHHHMQDLRVMGNLRQHLPVVQVGIIVSNLALCGFPFLSGFYSKDPVYEFSVSGTNNLVIVFFMVFGLLLTTTYSTRMVLLRQMGPMNQVPLINLHNERSFFVLPVVMLGSLAVVWGCVLNWLLLPPLVISPVSFVYGILPIGLFVLRVFGCYHYCLRRGEGPVYRYRGILGFVAHDGFLNIWFLRFISSQYVIKAPLAVGRQLLSVVDQG